MSALFGFVVGCLAVVAAFGFIIFIHELGHFLTARAVDIRCPQFAIGFGPSLSSFRWRGTNFAVRAFPLGGYVLMNGEEPGSRDDDPWVKAVTYYLGEVSFPAKPGDLLEVLRQIPESERSDAWREVHDQVKFARCQEFPTLQSVEGNFHDRSIPARVLVISGGVLMNFAATILILWMLGPLAGIGSFFQEWRPVIAQSFAGNPGAEAGLVSGDTVLEVAGKPTPTSLEAFHAIGAFKGEPFSLKAQTEAGQEKTLEVRPLLRIGYEAYKVADDDSLTLHDSKKSELVGKAVTNLKRAELVELVLVPEKVTEEGQGYEVVLEGSESPTRFEFPIGYKGPRGQLGIQFGVADVVFETRSRGFVASVKPGSPAEKAGFQVGDQFAAVDALGLISPSEATFGSLVGDALAATYRVPEVKSQRVVIVREGEPVVLTVEEKVQSLDELGLTLTTMTGGDLVREPFRMIGKMLAMPYAILQKWLTRQHTGKEIVENMQGPVGIMQILYRVHDNGLYEFLFFMALLNAAIGAFNLLPFPALDGARLVFLVLAGIRGEQIDPEKEAKIHLLGLMVLLCFVVVVTFGDIRRLISGQLFVL